MTAIRLPAAPPDTATGSTTSARVRAVLTGVGAVVVGAGLSLISGSLMSVFIVIGVLVVVVGAAYLWNEPDALFPIAIYVMWFEALPPGPINTGRTVAFLAIALPMARIFTSSWRIPAIQPRVWVPTMLLLMWAVLSALWSAQTGSWLAAFLGLFLGVSYTVLFALFVESPEQVIKLLRAFIKVGVVIGLLSALVHYGFGYRSFGFTGGPNQYAALNVMSVPICVVLAKRSEGLWRWFYIFAIPVFFLATLSAGSRSGLIGLGIIGGFCFVFRPGLALRQRAFWAVVGFFGIVGGFIIAGILDADRFSLLGFVSDRGGGRLDIWAAGLYGLRGNWLLGYGLGGFQKEALELLQKATGASLTVARQEDFKNTNTIPAHNLFLAAILDLGVVGFTLYFGTFLVAAKNLWDMLRTEWRDVAWIGLGIIVAFFGMAPFATGLNQKLPWAAVGLSGAYFVRHASTDRSVRRHNRLGRTHSDGAG